MSNRVPTFVGHVIGASFGMVFVLVNGSGLPAAVALTLRVAVTLAFVVVVIAFLRTAREFRRAGSPHPAGFTRSYRLIVAVEVIALLGGLALLRQVEPAAALGWTALVVGLHFLPLARLWPEGRAQLVAIATVMSVLGVIGLVLVLAFTVHDAGLVAVVSGVGSGLVLVGWSFRQALMTLAGRHSSAPAPD